MAVPVVKKRRRAQLSCDRCRRIKRQCDRNAHCGRCIQDGEECLWDGANRTEHNPRRRDTLQSPSQPATSKPDTIPSIGTSSFLQPPSSSNGFASTSSPHKCNTESAFGSHPSKASTVERRELWKLLSTPSFLREIVNLYNREIDWIWELFQNSRLERLLAEYDDYARDAPRIWDQVKIFAMAILAITAQLSPTDVELIIMCDESATKASNVTTHSADHIMRAAYDTVIDRLSELADDEACLSSWTLSKRQWSAEVFAASYLMRNYEKHTGSYRKQSERMAVDIARLQNAGYMQQPCRPCEMSKQWQIVEQAVDPQDWPTNHEALAHNVFWAYYTLDRLSTIAAGSTYTIQSMHANVCLNDVFGHTHVSHLNKVLSKDENALCSEGARPDMPVQSAYSGAKCRFAAVASHFADRLTAMRSPTFDWHKDVEAIVHDLDSDLHMFDKYVLPTLDSPADRFSKAKKLTLALCIELLRTSVASQLHLVFAATLFRRSLGVVTISPLARQRIGWELQKRKLESARSLIARVLSFGNASLLFRASWPFFASSVYVQVKEIVNILDEHLNKTGERMMDRGKREQLLEGLQSAIKGRNFLVLLTRKDHLPLTRSHVQQACVGLTGILRRCDVPSELIENAADEACVVDYESTVRALTEAIPRPQRSDTSALDTLAFSAARHQAPYPTPPDDEDVFDGLSFSSTPFVALASETNMDGLLTDLAELERLFTEPICTLPTNTMIM